MDTIATALSFYEVSMLQPSTGMLAELVLIVMCCVGGISAFAPNVHAGPPSSQPDAPAPDPKLQPQDVVRIVVDALSKNDANDSGIRITWKFASPENQTATGPVERFIPMVKGAAYAPMLNSKSAQYSDTQIKDDQAVQMVLLTASDGSKVAYIFRLSRQADGPLKGCWMTDAVFPVIPKEQPHMSGDDLPV